jgi:type IV pilus assembly protein PilO
MALLPQNPRNQKLVMVALVAVGLAAVYQQLVWTPQNAELNRLESRVDALDSLNRLTKLEVAKGTASQMKAEAASYSRELDVLRRLVPTQNEVPALLESVSSAARAAGLDLSDVQPDGVVNGDQFDTYKYKLGVIGSYHQVGEFLANVGSLSRIVAPINLSLLTTTNRTGEHKPKKDEQLLDAHFQIETYVAHVSMKPASAKVGE